MGDSTQYLNSQSFQPWLHWISKKCFVSAGTTSRNATVLVQIFVPGFCPHSLVVHSGLISLRNMGWSPSRPESMVENFYPFIGHSNLLLHLSHHSNLFYATHHHFILLQISHLRHEKIHNKSYTVYLGTISLWKLLFGQIFNWNLRFSCLNVVLILWRIFLIL